MLKRHGILDKVECIAAGGLGPALTALNQGAVDAAPLVDPNFTRKGADYQIVSMAADELPDLSWSVFVTTDEFLKSNDKIRRILRARAKAVDYMYAHPAETEKIYAKYWNLSEEDAKAMLPKFFDIKFWKRGEFNIKGFATMLEGMELVGSRKGLRRQAVARRPLPGHGEGELGREPRQRAGDAVTSASGRLRLAVLAGAAGALEVLCRTGVIPRLTMVPPSAMAEHLRR